MDSIASSSFASNSHEYSDVLHTNTEWLRRGWHEAYSEGEAVSPLLRPLASIVPPPPLEPRHSLPPCSVRASSHPTTHESRLDLFPEGHFEPILQRPRPRACFEADSDHVYQFVHQVRNHGCGDGREADETWGDRDAKGLSLELKRMLSASNPWDREVEFQRESYVTPSSLLSSA